MDDMTTNDTIAIDSPSQSTMPPPPPPPTVVGLPPSILPYSMARPFWYVALMFVLTFGLYVVVWFYRGWKVLLSHYRLGGVAVLNAIFSVLCALSFFRLTFKLGEEAGYRSRMPWQVAAHLYIIFYIAGRMIDRLTTQSETISAMDLASIMVSVLMLIPLREGVRAINAGYGMLSPDSRMRTRLSPWAIVTVVISSVIWIGILLFSFIPA